MAKVYLICGKLCSGKSTYAKNLTETLPAVLLSCDEITLDILGGNLGERHDETVEKVKEYLLRKSTEILHAGTDVVLDWGFWTKAERESTRAFYRRQGFDWETHYIDISDEEWQKRIAKRNQAISAGKTSDYYIDDNLVKKFDGIFEEMKPEEIDKYINGESCHGS